MRVAHPPEPVLPESAPVPELLSAYLRTFASHRYVNTAPQAMTALARAIGYAGQPADLWDQARAASAPLAWTIPIPTVEPYRRPSACVLAIASRLAPLTAGESDQELRTFLNALPARILNATARLAARTLPAPVLGASASDPTDMIIERLRVVQLVGAHRDRPP